MVTKIEWTEETWNPITGCTKISPGCLNCYAERMAKRLAGRAGYPADAPFRVTFHPDRLEQPYYWKGSHIFVCSMSDLFHTSVAEEWHERIFDVIEHTPRHTYQILTKRPASMRNKLGQLNKSLSNVQIGVTAEDQARADERIPVLLDIPAAVRFVSVEPMLGPVDLREYVECPFCNSPDQYYSSQLPCNCGHLLDWVIIGCETGPRRRPCNVEWVRDLVRQCQDAHVPVFVKALDLGGRVSKEPAEWPEDLRVREYPQ